MKSYAKLNLMLKITSKRADNYHEIASRFVLFKELYDEVFIVPKSLAISMHGFSKDSVLAALNSLIDAKILDNEYLINPKFSLQKRSKSQPSSHNIDVLSKYVTYQKGILSNFYSPCPITSKLFKVANINEEKFFKDYAIIILKNIPTKAGLGGASSNAAVIAKLLERKGLISNADKLSALIGADVSFFASETNCANVRGFGDEIEVLDDCSLPKISLKFSTPCDTKAVYQEFAKSPIYSTNAQELLALNNAQLLELNPFDLNDLLAPVLRIYPQANSLASKNMFLSGSGGTFFQIDKGER